MGIFKRRKKPSMEQILEYMENEEEIKARQKQKNAVKKERLDSYANIAKIVIAITSILTFIIVLLQFLGLGY